MLRTMILKNSPRSILRSSSPQGFMVMRSASTAKDEKKEKKIMDMTVGEALDLYKNHPRKDLYDILGVTAVMAYFILL